MFQDLPPHKPVPALPWPSGYFIVAPMSERFRSGYLHAWNRWNESLQLAIRDGFDATRLRACIQSGTGHVTQRSNNTFFPIFGDLYQWSGITFVGRSNVVTIMATGNYQTYRRSSTCDLPRWMLRGIQTRAPFLVGIGKLSLFDHSTDALLRPHFFQIFSS